MRHVAARGASVILAVLLGAAGVVACGGADDTEDQTQAGADSSDSRSGGGDGDNNDSGSAGGDGDNNGGGSGGGDGDNNGGAPGVPGGDSGGGAPGAPINIPAITDFEMLPVAKATERMKDRIRDACGGDLCLDVETEVQGEEVVVDDISNCTYGGRPPEFTLVPRDSKFVLIALCGDGGTGDEGDGDGGTGDEGDGDGGTGGEGGTDTGTDTDTETDTGDEAETQSTP